MNIPTELVDLILEHLNYKDILNVYDSKIFKLSDNNFKRLISDKLGLDVTNKDIFEIEYLCSKPYMMFILNKLAQGYHSGLGFDRPEIRGNINDNDFVNLLEEDYEYQGLDADEIYEEFFEDEETFTFDSCLLKDKAKLKLLYKTIILKYPVDYWYKRKTDEWYNQPSTWWKPYDKFKDRLLPYLNSRTYIKIDNPYMKVTISADDKGYELTIDDILFATRGLASDDTRCICEHDTQYTILYDDDNTLILRPNMDNFST